jgi:hypothetical protein
MPRYLVERTFTESFGLPVPNHAESARLHFIANNTIFGVVWLHSYVSPDRKKSFCLYEAPNPEALRRAAQRNFLPVERIIEVGLIDPYGLTD